MSSVIAISDDEDEGFSRPVERRLDSDDEVVILQEPFLPSETDEHLPSLSDLLLPAGNNKPRTKPIQPIAGPSRPHQSNKNSSNAVVNLVEDDSDIDAFTSPAQALPAAIGGKKQNGTSYNENVTDDPPSSPLPVPRSVSAIPFYNPTTSRPAPTTATSSTNTNTNGKKRVRSNSPSKAKTPSISIGGYEWSSSDEEPAQKKPKTKKQSVAFGKSASAASHDGYSQISGTGVAVGGGAGSRKGKGREVRVEDVVDVGREKAAQALAKEKAKADKKAEVEYKKRLIEVNKLRHSKSDVLREITLHLSPSLLTSPSPLPPLLPSLESKFQDSLSAIHTLPLDQIGLPARNANLRIMRLKRYVKANWDEGKKMWEPVEEGRERWVEEGWGAVLVLAEELAEMILVDRKNDSVVDGDISMDGLEGKMGLRGWMKMVEQEMTTTRLGDDPSTSSTSPSAPRKIILCIYNLKSYYSKTKSAANREYTARARAAMEGISTEAGRVDGEAGGSEDAGGAGRKKKAPVKKAGKERIEREEMERMLVKLNLEHGWYQVVVDTPADFEDWVWNMAADIAIRPYKVIQKSLAAFGSRDNARKGTSRQDTLELMLQEITGVTASGAVGISEQWGGSFRKLMEGFERAEREGEGREKTMLENCTVRHTKTGVQNERKIGPAVSRHIYNAFRIKDPTVPV